MFAGSEKCRDCHQAIYDGFITTPHNITSQPPSLKTIRGSFEEGKNMFAYSYYDQLLMEQTDSGFYQVHVRSNAEKDRRRMDMIIGSGVGANHLMDGIITNCTSCQALISLLPMHG